MITCQEKALEHMKMGVYDVLPAGSLDGLTAEDFRLLLNGVSGNFTTFLSHRFYVKSSFTIRELQKVAFLQFKDSSF